MSEHPDGIAPSTRQAPPPTDPEMLSDPRAAADDSVPPESTPPSRRLRTLDPSESGHDLESEPPSSADDPGRITRPYAETEEGADGEKRDTQPWRDDDPEDAPVSVTGELRASLSDSPPSAEERMLEDHRRFRHRGPFTRPQAELAAGQAADVQMVLEILTRYARQFFERSVLFVVTGTSAELRFAHGVPMGLASLVVDLEEQSVLSQAHDSGDPVVRPLAEDGADAILSQQAQHPRRRARGRRTADDSRACGRDLLRRRPRRRRGPHRGGGRDRLHRDLRQRDHAHRPQQETRYGRLGFRKLGQRSAHRFAVRAERFVAE